MSVYRIHIPEVPGHWRLARHSAWGIGGAPAPAARKPLLPLRTSFVLGLLLLVVSGTLVAESGLETTACGGSNPDTDHASATGGWSIHAGPVTLVTLDGTAVDGVSGRFEVCSPGSAGAESPVPRMGGACLLADLSPFGIGGVTCTTHSDCNQPGAFDRHDPRMTDYVGYCATRDGSGDAPTCWTRPGPASKYCRRTIDSLRLTAGPHVLGPVSSDPLGAGEPYAQWAVFACMAHEGHDLACGEPDSPHRQVSLSPR